MLNASTGHQSVPASCLAAPSPSFWNCSCPTFLSQVGTIPPSAQGRWVWCPPLSPSWCPPWILHDVNHGFEFYSCPLPESPTLPTPCLPWPRALLPPLPPVGQAGPCPAPAGMRSTDCTGLAFPPPSALIPTGQAGLPPARLAGYFGGSEGVWLFLVVVCVCCSG